SLRAAPGVQPFAPAGASARCSRMGPVRAPARAGGPSPGPGCRGRLQGPPPPSPRPGPCGPPLNTLLSGKPLVAQAGGGVRNDGPGRGLRYFRPGVVLPLVVDQAGGHGVVDIFLAGTHLQVFKPVVPLVTVLVVDFSIVRNRPEKGFHDQPV